MKIQLISTFPTRNLTLEIAFESKNSVLVAARVLWSQFMVPRREKGAQRLLGSLFLDLFYYFNKLTNQPEARTTILIIKSNLIKKAKFNLNNRNYFMNARKNI